MKHSTYWFLIVQPIVLRTKDTVFWEHGGILIALFDPGIIFSVHFHSNRLGNKRIFCILSNKEELKQTDDKKHDKIQNSLHVSHCLSSHSKQLKIRAFHYLNFQQTFCWEAFYISRFVCWWQRYSWSMSTSILTSIGSSNLLSVWNMMVNGKWPPNPVNSFTWCFCCEACWSVLSSLWFGFD